MLKTISSITTVFVFAALLNGCQQDPCEDTICLNGGVCVDGDCECINGYTGVNCGTPPLVDPCEGITCLNGGTCANGSCVCAEGYTGANCSQQVTPTAIRITSIRVDQFPPLDGGDDWDGAFCGGANPDLFVTLDDGQGEFFTSGMYTDAIPGNTYTFSNGLPTQTYNVNGNFAVRLYDNDTGGCAPSDYMGGLQGSIYSSNNGFPSSIRFYNASAQIDVTMQVQYIF